MTYTIRRGLFSVALAGLASLALSTPALAAPSTTASDHDEPAVVDKPDTGGLHNTWTFAPLGVPVFGLVDAVADVPEELL